VIVTVKVQLLVLPLASVAVFVTVVTPTENVLPLGGLLTRFVTLQLSVAVTLKVTLLRLQRPASAAKTRLPGQVSTGF
jgi:galactitol-specific phosphotransferase system IIC component